MYYYILNPAAGKGKAIQLQDRLRAQLKQAGIPGEIVKTTGIGEATKLARQAVERGHSTIVGIGGDGTINEVINGVNSENAAVGIIPLGHTNTLAQHFGITNWHQAIGVLAARKINTYGLIGAGQNHFLSNLTLGFETDVEKRIDQPAQGIKQHISQFAKTFGHAQAFKPLSAHLTIDDEIEISANIFSLSVGNLRFSNPEQPNRLIISISDKPSKRQMTEYMWKIVKRSSPLEEAASTRITAGKLLIRTSPETGITIDGKLAGRTPIAIRLTNHSIRMITAKSSPNRR